jgi:pectate lyase
VYNNYYNDTGNYGVASTENAGVRVERNYFENVEDPFHLGEGSSGDGRLVAIDNCLVNSGSGQTGGSVAAIPYPYSADAACSVKSIVMGGAGPGRIST